MATTLTPELKKQYNDLQQGIRDARVKAKGAYTEPVQEAHKKMSDFITKHPNIKTLIRKERKEKKRQQTLAKMNSPEALARRERTRKAMENLRKMTQAWFSRKKESTVEMLKRKKRDKLQNLWNLSAGPKKKMSALDKIKANAAKRAAKTQKQAGAAEFDPSEAEFDPSESIFGFFAHKVKNKKKEIAYKQLAKANANAVNLTVDGEYDTTLEMLYLMVSTPEELENDKDEEELFELECQFVENGGNLEDLMYYN